MCKTKKSDDKLSKSFGQVSSAEDSDSEESSGQVVVEKLDSNTIGAMVFASGPLNSQVEQQMKLATDTGISKTLLNPQDWNKIKHDCKFVKTSKRFCPYGTMYPLLIKGKAEVQLKAERGATINTTVYVHSDNKEQSLLGESDAIRLGIVTLDLKGAPEEVEIDTVKRISHIPKPKIDGSAIVSYNMTQKEVDAKMEAIVGRFRICSQTKRVNARVIQ